MHTTIFPVKKSQISAFFSSDFMPNLTVGLHAALVPLGVHAAAVDDYYCSHCMAMLITLNKRGSFSQVAGDNLFAMNQFKDQYPDTAPIVREFGQSISELVSINYYTGKTSQMDMQNICAAINLCTCDESWCTTQVEWQNNGVDNEMREGGRCTSEYTCEPVVHFRCPNGSYGTPTSLSGGCTACPNGGFSQNNPIDNTGTNSISKCFIPAGHTGSDASGKFTYADNCYY